MLFVLAGFSWMSSRHVALQKAAGVIGEGHSPLTTCCKTKQVWKHLCNSATEKNLSVVVTSAFALSSISWRFICMATAERSFLVARLIVSDYRNLKKNLESSQDILEWPGVVSWFFGLPCKWLGPISLLWMQSVSKAATLFLGLGIHPPFTWG